MRPAAGVIFPDSTAYSVRGIPSPPQPLSARTPRPGSGVAYSLIDATVEYAPYTFVDPSRWYARTLKWKVFPLVSPVFL